MDFHSGRACPRVSGRCPQKQKCPRTVKRQQSTGLIRYPRLEPRDTECAAKLKKRTLTILYNAYGCNDFAAILEHTGRVKFTISTKAAGSFLTQIWKDILQRWKNLEKSLTNES